MFFDKVPSLASGASLLSFAALYPSATYNELWFLTAGPVVCIPMILTEFPERKNCGSFFEKQNRHE